MSRPSVRKVNGQWTSRRPGYGFNQDQTRTHDSWKAAMRTFDAGRQGASGLITETVYQHEEISCREE